MKFRIEHHGRTLTDGQGKIIYLGKGLAAPSKKDIKFGREILSSLNNTYGEGINPEAVPDVIKALELFVNRVSSDLWDDITSGKLSGERVRSAFVKEAKLALEKAKLR